MNTSITAIAAAVIAISLPMTFYLVWTELIPYTIALRVKKIIDEINLELPSLLADWRVSRGHRRRSGD